MHGIVRVRWIAALFLAWGCGSQVNSTEQTVSDEPATANDVKAYCEARCNYGDRCYAGIPIPNCAGDCATRLERAGSHVRAAYYSTYSSCLAEGCDTGISECERRAYAAAGVNDADVDPDAERCSQKFGGCRIDVSVCDDVPILVPAAYDEVIACMDVPCAELRACLEPLFGAL